MRNNIEDELYNMTAFKAMCEILDINETIESLKLKNMGNTPNLEICQIVDLLANYRDILTAEMRKTDLKVFQKDA